MKRLLTGALALSLLTGTAAMAQPDRHNDHGGYAQGHQDRSDNRGDNRGHNRGDNQGYNRGENGGGHRWARGQRLPNTYYQDRSHYVDYRSHRLRRPPRGYQWVQADNNYALVALTTGLIASVVASSH
ncbi:MAG: RcnB family protein [Caulobacterales bacterium]|jgi:Ni/Co efflux regulator RcnB